MKGAGFVFDKLVEATIERVLLDPTTADFQNPVIEPNRFLLPPSPKICPLPALVEKVGLEGALRGLAAGGGNRGCFEVPGPT